MIKLGKFQNHIICTSGDINKIIRLRTNVPIWKGLMTSLKMYLIITS